MSKAPAVTELYLALRRRPFRERGDILEGLSPSRGRVGAVASRGREAGLFDPPVLLEARLTGDGSGLLRLSQSVLRHSFSRLKKGLPELMVAGFLSRLFLACVPEGQPDEGVFRLLCSLFEGLNDGLPPVSVGLWGQDRLLCELGLAPGFECCLGCGNAEVSGFSASDGGVLCDSCYSGRGFALPGSAVQVCRAVRRLELGEAHSCLPGEVSLVSRVYKEHFLTHLGLSDDLFRRVLPPGQGRR